MLFTIFLVFLPCTFARLDLEPLYAPAAITFCIGPECPGLSLPGAEEREIEFNCNGTTDTKYADDKDCHSYYKCENGTATKLTCPSGYAFYKLGKHWGYCAVEAYVQSCNVVDCRLGRFLPHPRDCTKFFICVNGYPYELNCPAGTFYNSQVERCVFLPDDVPKPCGTLPDKTTTLAPDNSTPIASSTEASPVTVKPDPTSTSATTLLTSAETSAATSSAATSTAATSSAETGQPETHETTTLANVP